MGRHRSERGDRNRTVGVKSSKAYWIAWSVWGLSIALIGLGVVFLILNLPGEDPYSPYFLNNGVAALVFSTVGALVSSRRPENPVGWLFVASGVLFAVEAFTGEYGAYAALPGSDSSLPGGVFALWVSSWIWVAGGFLVLFTFLLFPDGRLPSRRWRVAALLALFGVLLEMIFLALEPGSLAGVSPAVENPFGIGSGGLLTFVEAVSVPLGIVSVVAPLFALIVRFVRGNVRERQQIKWVIYAVGVLAVAILVVGIWPPLDGTIVAGALFLIGFLAIPTAIGIAILRYQLLDIDVIINRTLVYGVLTVALALIYVACIVTLQYVFRVITGQETQLAIVASTLAIAALFGPLRSRVQEFIDRRFYRQRYDSRKTLEAFGQRLRKETDLEALGGDLIEVVRDTMQPESVSLWLAPQPKSGSANGGVSAE